jgi:hypothetical protein
MVMTPKQRNALYYRLGENEVIRAKAQRKYNDAMSKAYCSQGIAEKRKEFRRLQAVSKGIVAKLSGKGEP